MVVSAAQSLACRGKKLFCSELIRWFLILRPSCWLSLFSSQVVKNSSAASRRPSASNTATFGDAAGLLINSDLKGLHVNMMLLSGACPIPDVPPTLQQHIDIIIKNGIRKRSGHEGLDSRLKSRFQMGISPLMLVWPFHHRLPVCCLHLYIDVESRVCLVSTRTG